MPGLPPAAERTPRAVYEQVLAAGIAAHGIGHQEPAALLLDNSLDAVYVWSGTGLGGRVEVPVNTAYKGHFLTHVLNDSAAGSGCCRWLSWKLTERPRPRPGTQAS